MRGTVGKISDWLTSFLEDYRLFFCVGEYAKYVFDQQRLIWYRHSRTSFEKNCFSAWASTLNMGLINKVDMVCLSPVGYGV